MGVIKRQTIKSSFFLYIGVVLGAINMLFIFPAFLEAKQIGLYRVLFSASLLFSSLSLFGSAQLQVRFFSFFQNQEEKKKFFSLNLALSILGYLLFIMLFDVFQEPILNYYKKNSPLILDYYYLVYPLTFFLLLFSFLSAYARVSKRITIPNFLKDVFTRAGIMLLIVLYGFSFISFDSFLNSIIFIVYGLALFILALYVFRLNPTSIHLRFWQLKGSLMKRMIKYASLSTLTGVASILVGTIDSLMISGIKDLNQTGIYSIAFFMGTIIEIPKRSLSQISSPIIAKAWKENDLVEIKKVYQKSSLNQLIFGSLILVLIWVNINDIFRIIPQGELFYQGKYVVLYIALGKLFDMAAGVNSEIIGNSNYYFMNIAFILILAVLTVFTNYFFIPIFGIEGAALASLISFVLFNSCKMTFLLLKYKMQPFNLNSLNAMLIGVVVLLIGLFLPETGIPLLNIIGRTLICAGLFCIAIVKLKISDDLSGVWRNLLGRLKRS